MKKVLILVALAFAASAVISLINREKESERNNVRMPPFREDNGTILDYLGV